MNKARVLEAIDIAINRVKERDEAFSCHAVASGGSIVMDILEGEKLSGVYSAYIAPYRYGTIFNYDIIEKLEPDLNILEIRVKLLTAFRDAVSSEWVNTELEGFGLGPCQALGYK